MSVRMHVERRGMTVTTEHAIVDGEAKWVSTVCKDGKILGKKFYRQSTQAILGHARLASVYLEELTSEA